MSERRLGYILLACLAAVMVAGLMLDDPTAQLALFLEVNTARLERSPVVLFPEIESPFQIYGLEVEDIRQGRSVFLQRDDSRRWTMPDPFGDEAPLPAGAINQDVVEQAVVSLAVMAAPEWYEATSNALETYGLRPQPSYRVGLAAHDTGGVRFMPVILEVGDANPDSTAYYVWPQGDSRIYLISQSLLGPVLGLVTDPEQLTALAANTDASETLEAPVP